MAVSARVAARQQQVGDVGAGDEQDKSGERHQQAEPRDLIRPHVLDTAAGARDDDVLLAERRTVMLR
jgi:hypothetical protein